MPAVRHAGGVPQPAVRRGVAQAHELAVHEERHVNVAEGRLEADLDVHRALQLGTAGGVLEEDRAAGLALHLDRGGLGAHHGAFLVEKADFNRVVAVFQLGRIEAEVRFAGVRAFVGRAGGNTLAIDAQLNQGHRSTGIPDREGAVICRFVQDDRGVREHVGIARRSHPHRESRSSKPLSNALLHSAPHSARQNNEHA